MLQEAKSLKHTKNYLSNRNLRDCIFQDEVENNLHQPGSKISLIATNNNSVSPQLTPNILIGDADTFFLLRENDKYQQQINELIDEIQANHLKQSAVSIKNQQLLEDLDKLRRKNTKNVSTMNLLHKISENLVLALRTKSKMAIKMANIIKKLENSIQSMAKKLQTVINNKEQIQHKYSELYKHMQIYEQKMRNRLQSSTQSQLIKFEHVAIQVGNELVIYKQCSAQSESIIHHQVSTQTSISTHEKQINKSEAQKRDISCSTQEVVKIDNSLQIGTAVASLLQRAQQTNQQIMKQSSTQHEKTVFLQAYTQYQQPQQSLLIESLEIETQTDRVQTQTVPIMTQRVINQQKNMQTQQYKNLKLHQNQLNFILISGKSQDSGPQIIFKTQLRTVNQVNIQIQQNQRSTFQTQVTQQDRKSTKVGLIDKQVNQNILGYFKQINTKNQINYNEQIVRNLQEKGQTQASKALARLMKQHMCLKLCLNRLIEKQGEQLQSQNEKIIEVFEQSRQNKQQTQQISQNNQSPIKEGSPQKEQCSIY